MAFTLQTLRKQAAAGEDSTRQFKSRIDNADSLAAEMAAFANADGGVIFIGVQDDGTISGMTSQEVHAANQLISNAASQHVRSPLVVQTQNILLENGNVVIALTVPAGMDKPYFDRKGVIWLKAGRTSDVSIQKRNCAVFFSIPANSMPMNCPQRRTLTNWTSCCSGIF